MDFDGLDLCSHFGGCFCLCAGGSKVNATPIRFAKIWGTGTLGIYVGTMLHI